ncbi:MAG: hypothetical protein D6719_07185 [Candidatus Dadabacteria bacterium]|nr:MAG: hypothetical protein D6719_07185 [Candidatus Dadabacteria bacterium]
MVDTAAIIRTITAAVEVKAEWARSFDTTINLVVRGRDGGDWTIKLTGERPAVISGSREADCVIQLDSDILADIWRRKVNPQRAWLEGRIQVSGDGIAALKFVDILEGALDSSS